MLLTLIKQINSGNTDGNNKLEDEYVNLSDDEQHQQRSTKLKSSSSYDTKTTKQGREKRINSNIGQHIDEDGISMETSVDSKVH